MIKRIALLTVIASTLLFSCKNSQSDKNSKEKNTQTETKPKNEKLQKLELEASRLRAGGSIKNVELDNGKATIEYVKDYNEYKKVNPQSSLSKSMWETYWETGEAVKKAMVDGSVKLMKKLDYLNEVNIKIPYKTKTYSIDVKKSKLEKFVGSDFKTIKSDWDNKFSNPYVYDDNGRNKFFTKFGTVE